MVVMTYGVLIRHAVTRSVLNVVRLPCTVNTALCVMQSYRRTDEVAVGLSLFCRILLGLYSCL